MNRPLYQSIAQGRLSGKTRGFHRGLWFERFMSEFGGEAPNAEQKRSWMETVAGSESHPVLAGDAAELDRHASAQLALVKTRKGCWMTFDTDWHFVSGMGLPHPVENGFSWHHTLGVPYLCGAAVKGLIRAWMEHWNGADGSTLLRWLGSAAEQQEQDLQTGGFIFFDALPLEPPELIVDIMTPHMGKWYEKGGEEPMDAGVVPGDWHDPTPIPFLAVKQARFRFCIAPRTPDIGMEEVKSIMEELRDALGYLGAGAKTAAGYGVMNESPSSAGECEKYWSDNPPVDEPRSDLSPEEKTYRKLAENCPANLSMEDHLYGELLHAGKTLENADSRIRVFVAGKLREMMEQAGSWVGQDEQVTGNRKKRQRKCKKIQAIIHIIDQ
ncbi:type III-B CRISPR module RAMP protein Cmr6 [Thiolapillus sp.]